MCKWLAFESKSEMSKVDVAGIIDQREGIKSWIVLVQECLYSQPL